jgi:hypothetical protein
LRHPLAGRVFIRTQRVADFRQAALLEEAEQQGIAVLAPKFVEHFVGNGHIFFYPLIC